jgi:glycosyltransferase involved in cell wall biosynthesis
LYGYRSDNVKKIIGFPTRPVNKGGPGSFQLRFEEKLKEKGWDVIYPDKRATPPIILINGNTKHIWWLVKSKIKGCIIIFRLGGINWLYKQNPHLSVFKKFQITVKNSFIPLIQKLLGDAIIYQSEFSKKWLRKFGQSASIKNSTVIYNGVDINIFKPFEVSSQVNEKKSLVCVEGNLDYTPYTISLLNFLQKNLVEKNILKEIKIFGNFENITNREKLDPLIKYHGFLDKSQIQTVYQNAIFLSLDINPACPNAVLEALSCGTPVVGFNTGALEELVLPQAGMLVEFKGNPWKPDTPEFSNLIPAIANIIRNYEYFSVNARQIAIEKYSIEDMTNKYLDKIIEISNG